MVHLALALELLGSFPEWKWQRTSRRPSRAAAHARLPPTTTDSKNILDTLSVKICDYQPEASARQQTRLRKPGHSPNNPSKRRKRRQDLHRRLTDNLNTMQGRGHSGSRVPTRGGFNGQRHGRHASYNGPQANNLSDSSSNSNSTTNFRRQTSASDNLHSPNHSRLPRTRSPRGFMPQRGRTPPPPYSSLAHTPHSPRPTNTPPHFRHSPNPIMEDNEWKSWQTMKVKVFDLPLDVATIDLYKLFKHEGTISRIEIVRVAHGKVAFMVFR